MDNGHGKTVIFDPKQNEFVLFVLSGHGSESFAAFLNGVILQKKTTRQLSLQQSSRHKSRDNVTFI